MTRTWIASLFIPSLLSAGCIAADQGEPGDPEVIVIVSEEHVEVYAHQPGSCRTVGEVPEPNACNTASFALMGPTRPFEVQPFCVPDPTCVEEVRLERAGELVASAAGRTASFSTSVTGRAEHVVLGGCGEPLVIDLPPPLTSDVVFQLEADSNAIHVAAAGPGVQSVLSRAASLLSYPNSFASSCRSELGPVDLPTSQGFDQYVVTSLALAEPSVLRQGSVRVFPAREHEQVVSKTIPLGPLWDAAVAAAELSAHHAVCDGYCTAWKQSCQPSANAEECTVFCVAQGSSYPACAEQWRAYLDCERAAETCASEPVEGEPEPALDSNTGAAPSRCEAESSAYGACVTAANG